MREFRNIVLAILGFRGQSPAFRSLMRRIRHLWGFVLTHEGKLILLCALMSGVIGSVSIAVPVYHLFCAIAGMFLATFFVSRVLRPHVAMEGYLPPNSSAGETFHVDYAISNRGNRPAFDLLARLVDPPDSLEASTEDGVPALSPGDTGTLRLFFHPLKRGLYGPLCVQTYSVFPFNFFRASGPNTVHKNLLVYPNFTPLIEIDISVGRRFQPGGIALTSNTGESPEYIGNREYRAGDPIRRIDFRAWARLGKPAIREYQEEYFCRVALVIDTYVPGSSEGPPSGFPELEAAISLCASIADVLARGEYIIDLFAAGPELYVFRAGRQTAHFENVLEILSCIDECRTDPFETVTPALVDELSGITSLICIFLDWDEARAGLVRTALDCGCTVKPIVVCEGEPTMPLDSAEVVIERFTPRDIRSGAIERL